MLRFLSEPRRLTSTLVINTAYTLITTLQSNETDDEAAIYLKLYEQDPIYTVASKHPRIVSANSSILITSSGKMYWCQYQDQAVVLEFKLLKSLPEKIASVATLASVRSKSILLSVTGRMYYELPISPGVTEPVFTLLPLPLNERVKEIVNYAFILTRCGKVYVGERELQFYLISEKLTVTALIEIHGGNTGLLLLTGGGEVYLSFTLFNNGRHSDTTNTQLRLQEKMAWMFSSEYYYFLVSLTGKLYCTHRCRYDFKLIVLPADEVTVAIDSSGRHTVVLTASGNVYSDDKEELCFTRILIQPIQKILTLDCVLFLLTVSGEVYVCGTLSGEQHNFTLIRTCIVEMLGVSETNVALTDDAGRVYITDGTKYVALEVKIE